MTKKIYTESQKKKLEEFAEEGRLRFEHWSKFIIDFEDGGELLGGRTVKTACLDKLKERAMPLGENWDDHIDIITDLYIELDLLVRIQAHRLAKETYPEPEIGLSENKKIYCFIPKLGFCQKTKVYCFIKEARKLLGIDKEKIKRNPLKIEAFLKKNK